MSAPRILIVEDSTMVRITVKRTLAGVDFNVDEAKDGQEGLNMATASADQPYDLILSDINMPNMDGIALVRELRQLDAYKYTPILMLTTETAGDKKMAGKSAGATGWVVKPFNPDKLLATIKKVIG